MTTIELYIDGVLCDLDKDFSVRLNRKFLNVEGLSAKDAQYSYSITLPLTGANNAAFGFANVEETRGKFNRVYGAELIVAGIRIFIGKFRLSEISAKKYKGNLYVPAAKTVEDIFGDMSMNQIAPYLLPFGDYITSVNECNAKPDKAIFPYVLYSLLPKVPQPDGGYTAKTVWDSSVIMGRIRPSVNVTELLKHIFNSKRYSLGGTALTDDRLTKLYMSYKNAPDYAEPWNWGTNGRVEISGKWNCTKNMRTDSVEYEEAVYQGNDSTDDYTGRNIYACDVLDSNNASIDIVSDPGGNVRVSRRTIKGRERVTTQISVPVSGFYKIVFTASISRVVQTPPTVVEVDGIRYVIGVGMYRNAVKVLRDRKRGYFDLSYPRMDAMLYRDNLPQSLGSDPRYMPAMYTSAEVSSGYSLVFVDAAQDDKHLVGFQWGSQTKADVNELDNGNYHNFITAAKPARSWDISNEEVSRLAINNPKGYYRYDGGGWNAGAPENGTDKYRMQLDGLDVDYICYQNFPQSGTFFQKGQTAAVVWLEAGELLTVVDASDEVEVLADTGWSSHDLSFSLSIVPYRNDGDWYKVDDTGKGTDPMNWGDPGTFPMNGLDLAGFLPADMKVDSFINNFCKAFNLQLSQPNDNTFSLDLKPMKGRELGQPIDLDRVASIRDRVNTPLGIPSEYRIGFTVNVDEEGYVATGDDGGGTYFTGTTEENVIEQKSSFSYNWFKDITKDGVVLPIPVITKHEIWKDDMSYLDAISKLYTDLAIRFWYADGLLNDLGTSFDFGGRPLSVAKVSNVLPGKNILNYKNARLTILDNYFTLLIGGSSHFTEIEGYLTPEQYNSLKGLPGAIFNGDVYYVAEISGYDPAGRNKAKLKLIKYGS